MLVSTIRAKIRLLQGNRTTPSFWHEKKDQKINLFSSSTAAQPLPQLGWGQFSFLPRFSRFQDHTCIRTGKTRQKRKSVPNPITALSPTLILFCCCFFTGESCSDRGGVATDEGCYFTIEGYFDYAAAKPKCTEKGATLARFSKAETVTAVLAHLNTISAQWNWVDVDGNYVVRNQLPQGYCTWDFWQLCYIMLQKHNFWSLWYYMEGGQNC